jgi:ubiquinone/menaquinone biosynthesis C-methylase UbiE/uncharacterized protein YbaR (Trm112 family)
VKHSLASIFICPGCGSKLSLIVERKTGDRIHKGRLFCEKCKQSFEIVDDIVLFKKLKEKDKDKKKIKEMEKLFLGPELRKVWYEHFPGKELSLLKKEWDFMIENLNLPKSKIHLDWATGTGRFLRNILDKAGTEIVAMDFGYANCLGLQKFLKKIGKYSKVTIVCGDARKIFLADNSIDSISSWHGLDEPNIEKALEESMRILKKSGRIALAGLLYDKGSESLKLAKKAGIQFAEKDKAYNYIKKIGFRNIKYKEFSRMKEKTNQNYIPKRGDYSTSYVIFAIK